MKGLIILYCIIYIAIATILPKNQQYSTRNSSCQLQYANKNNKLLEIYWINLETSTDRKAMMQNYLSYYGLKNNHRVKAVTPNNVVVPGQLSKPQQCKILNKNQTLDEIANLKQKHQGLYPNQPMNRTILVTGHCGRPKNSRKELTVTMSHLLALYKAVFSHQSHTQEYILVLEDDLQFGIEIDFGELINQAPKDFIILQLLTSNFYVINHLLKFYTSSQKQLFVKRKDNDDYWCAGAYLIHRQRFKQLFNSNILTKKSEKLYVANILAGYTKPDCVPRQCCQVVNGSTALEFITNYKGDSPCLKSARGYQADNFVFAIASEHVYILTVPIMLNTKVGNISTLHQEHVSIHHLAFQKTKEIIKDMFLYSKYQTTPSFVNRNCVLNYSSDVLI